MNCSLLLCPWDFPDKNTAVGSHSLLQGLFLTQGLNLGLLHSKQILYHLSHQGSTIQIHTHTHTHYMYTNTHTFLSTTIYHSPRCSLKRDAYSGVICCWKQHFQLNIPNALGTNTLKSSQRKIIFVLWDPSFPFTFKKKSRRTGAF